MLQKHLWKAFHSTEKVIFPVEKRMTIAVRIGGQPLLAVISLGKAIHWEREKYVMGRQRMLISFILNPCTHLWEERGRQLLKMCLCWLVVGTPPIEENIQNAFWSVFPFFFSIPFAKLFHTWENFTQRGVTEGHVLFMSEGGQNPISWASFEVRHGEWWGVWPTGAKLWKMKWSLAPTCSALEHSFRILFPNMQAKQTSRIIGFS